MVAIRKESELGYPNAPLPRGTLFIIILEKDPKYRLQSIGEMTIADFYELDMAKEYANTLEKKKEAKSFFMANHGKSGILGGNNNG